MSRILLADDSPHAQRMGERILRDEGYEVVSVTDGQTALLRLAEVDPDLVMADAFLPGKPGIELCRYLKSNPLHSHARVVLTAGLLEAFDEAEATAAGADAIIKKPFEASAVVETIRPLVALARESRASVVAQKPVPPVAAAPAVPPVSEAGNGNAAAAAPPKLASAGLSEEERVRAAVVVALDAEFPALVDAITSRVLAARRQ